MHEVQSRRLGLHKFVGSAPASTLLQATIHGRCPQQRRTPKPSFTHQRHAPGMSLVHYLCLFPPSRPPARRRRRRKIAPIRHQPTDEKDHTRRHKSVAGRLGSVHGTYPDVWCWIGPRARVQARSGKQVRPQPRSSPTTSTPPSSTPAGSQETSQIVSCAPRLTG